MNGQPRRRATDSVLIQKLTEGEPLMSAERLYLIQLVEKDTVGKRQAAGDPLCSCGTCKSHREFAEVVRSL